jgi:hypothetical protein
MVDNDDAGEFPRPGRARQIGLALIAVMAAERNGFRTTKAGGGMMGANSAML